MIHLADIYWVHNTYVPGIVKIAEESEKEKRVCFQELSLSSNETINVILCRPTLKSFSVEGKLLMHLLK